MIGVFDSGIGGLTVVREIMQALPNHDIVYFGDTARTPYGTKSPRTVIAYTLENIEFLIEKGAKVIVIACNTASSVAFESAAAVFDMPIFEVVRPAADFAVKSPKHARIGVIGTRTTINSGIYERVLKEMEPEVSVYQEACPLLVSLVEEGRLDKPETRMIVKKYLIPLKNRQVETLILGCTHYPVLKKVIQQKIGKRVTIIDSSTAVAHRVRAFLEESPRVDAMLSKNGKFELYVSDVTRQFHQTARVILKRNVNLLPARTVEPELNFRYPELLKKAEKQPIVSWK